MMKTLLQFLALLIIHLSSFSQSAPELVFENPVLINGTALRQGSVYLFSNVKQGVDATIKLKKFSRNDIVMPNVDRSDLGWSKAFQPEFGLAGSVPPFQNWYIDFEVTFYQAGTFVKKSLDTVDFTALDVDGDNISISEYVTYDKPNSIVFTTLTALTTSPAGLIGSIAECGEDGISSAIIICPFCAGTGVIGATEDTNCDGTGKLHQQCMHSYQGGTGTNVNGPVTNFANIDTSALQVMSVYRYLNRNKINFRYGAKSGALSSSAGLRLNSMWFRRFNLQPMNILPLKMTSLEAILNNKKVDLKWTVESEANISHYIVERSTNGINFKEIGMQFSNSETGANIEYFLTDDVKYETSKIVYYRIRTIEKEGKYQLSETKIIKLNSSIENKLHINIYPNPVVNELKVTIPLIWQNKKVSFEVISVNGQTANKFEIANSSQTERINVNNLNPGVYIVRVSCEGQVLQQKVIKQ